MGKRIERYKIGETVLKFHKKGSGKSGHFLGLDSGGMNNCGGLLAHLTRPVRSMSSKGMVRGKYDKKKWQKRIRGYFKTNLANKFD